MIKLTNTTLLQRTGVRLSKEPKLFESISADIILFVSSKRRRLEARNFAVILIFIPITTYMKRRALQNKRVGDLRSYVEPLGFLDRNEEFRQTRSSVRKEMSRE